MTGPIVQTLSFSAAAWSRGLAACLRAESIDVHHYGDLVSILGESARRGTCESLGT